MSRSRVFLFLIVLLAAVLRLWQLDNLPPGLYHDEAYNGLDALSLVQGKTFPQFYEGWELYAQEAHGENPPVPTRWPLFFEGNYGREPLHVYLMALSIWLFGPTPFAIRLVPALSGVLAVLLTYVATKELLDLSVKANDRLPIANRYSYVPLLAAFFLAILVPAIHFSRFGLRAMVFVPVEMLTVFFFWRGYNRSHLSPSSHHPITRSPGHLVTWSFLAAGFFLGLGIYIYAAARLFPLLFVLFVLFWAWRDWASLRQNLLNVAAMAVVSLVTALPLLYFFWRYPYFFVFRIAYVANRGLGTVEDRPLLTWLLNVGRVVRGLYWQGETHLRHNLPGRPYLDPIQAILFTLGLVHSLRQKLNPRTVFLVLWLLVMLLPTVMSGDAPHFGRMTGAAGPVAIVAAVGAVSLGEWFMVNGKRLMLKGGRSPKTLHYSLFTFYLLLLTGSLTFTIRDYFIRYANHPQLTADFYLPDWELGQFAAAQPPGTALYLSPTQEEMATIFFALANPEGLQSYSGTGELVPVGKPGATAVYLVRPTDEANWQRLTGLFPQAEVDQSRPEAWVMRVPNSAAQAVAAVVEQEVAHSFADQIRLVGYAAHVVENRLLVTLVWQAEAEMNQSLTAFVHVLDGRNQILAQLDRPPAGYPTTDWLPGELIVDTFTITLPDELPPGPYTLQTGFYDLATLVNVGDTAVLSTLDELP
jgi:4-amino-4-deoxy-L-arabinose transferase-like glycosyltransferase